MEASKYREKAETHLLHTYNRYPVVFTKGEGVWLYDIDGKSYLDFGAGIAVNALGHAHPKLTQALQEQIGKLMHTSNLYYHDQLAEAAEKLARAAGMQKVFFTNSGAEAIEGAIKAARKAAVAQGHPERTEIIAMQHSFHGRTFGALSVTGNEAYREPFEPLVGGIRFATFNDLKSVEKQITKNTCAIIVEPIQGEGGVIPAEPSFLQGLRDLCDVHDLFLLFDEIQCGMGRCAVPFVQTDSAEATLAMEAKAMTEDRDADILFAWQAYGVQPDILTTAKALGCGFPVGAFLLNEKAADKTLVPGDHGTTYGGNPMACRAVSAVLDIFSEEGLSEQVWKRTPFWEEQLDALVADSPYLSERRGRGFLQGLVVKSREEQEQAQRNSGASEEQMRILTPGEIVQEALQRGLLILTAEQNVLRLAPPLVIEEKELLQGISILREILT